VFKRKVRNARRKSNQLVQKLQGEDEVDQYVEVKLPRFAEEKKKKKEKEKKGEKLTSLVLSSSGTRLFSRERDVLFWMCMGIRKRAGLR
jgi:hypothetical protein